MVNAYSVDTGLVLGQLKTNAKSNEITIIPELLKLIRVKGRVISVDAMGCQRSLAELIVGREGDYLMSVKDNQPSLHKVFTDNFSLEKLSHYAKDSFEQNEVGQRGRKILRSYIVIPFTEKFGDFATKWKGLKSLCVAVTYQQKNGELGGSVGIRYFISSKEMKAEEFGKLCRGHWGVESMHCRENRMNMPIFKGLACNCNIHN